MLIYTADIESIILEGKHVPIMIALKSENLLKVFDFNENFIIWDSTQIIISSELLIIEFLNFLETLETKDIVVYFHNLSNYDGFFLIKHILKKKNQHYIRKNKIYYLKIFLEKKTIYFKDSYLLIPFSLYEASLLFNLKFDKVEFNFKNVRELMLLTVKDRVSYFSLFKLYLIRDVNCLYELIVIFKTGFYKLFNLNPLNFLTLSSISLNIFVKKYYKDRLSLLSVKQDIFVRNAYFGGISDIYKPYGKNLVLLDFNSMYPSIMYENEFGLGSLIFVKNIKDLELFCTYNLGFVKCIVSCDDNIEYPILPLRVDGRLIQPTGHFIGTYYTKEILYAIKTGFYTFTPIVGYMYEKRGFIFKSFVNDLFEYKTKCECIGFKKILKKLMNLLYGRFALTLDTTETLFLDGKDDKINKIINNQNDIIDIDWLSDELDLLKITYKLPDYSWKRKNIRVKIDWAAAVTSLARIKMAELKKINTIYYYTDTDSIVIKESELYKFKHLLDDFNLGKLKIVCNIKEAYFLSPKTYALKLKSNKKDNLFIIKNKGLSLMKHYDKQTLYNLFRYIYKNNIKLYPFIETKLFRKNMYDFSIMNSEVGCVMNISFNFDKRQKIYDDSGKWVLTKPYKINNKISA